MVRYHPEVGCLEKNDSYLVVFDVEGVLLPKRRFLLFEIAARLGPSTFLRFLLIGILYEVGILSIESALRRLFRLLRGISIDDLYAQYRRLPLMYGTRELFEELRRHRFKMALVSSGLPRAFVEDLANRLGADHAFGLEIGIANGRLTGEIGGDVVKPDGKAIALKKILETEGLPSHSCIVVADDRNNLPMLRACGMSVGYNPDFILTVKSDYVVRGDLSRILPLLTKRAFPRNTRSLSRGEVLRELIHIGGISIPFVCMHLLGDLLVALLIVMVASIYAVSEFSRMLGKNLPVFSTITLKAADKSELQELAMRPISYALGIVFSLLLLNPPISYASIAVLTIGDGSAAIFGKLFGRTVSPLNKGKRVEGSVAGLIFAFLGSLLFVNPAKALVGAIGGILAESVPSPIDDNLMIPLVSGLAMTIIA